jgi:tetratricopeptide (TPR) repeat protein
MTKGAILSLSVLAIFTTSACAVADEGTGYSQCVALVDSNATGAEEHARLWEKQGGGAAAVHCHALALTALHRYAEAARDLEGLAHAGDLTAADRAALYDQAGNAWLLAGDGHNAVQSFVAALAATPNDVGILADRARAKAMLKDWAGADADLSAALVQDQNRADLLVLRSSARWAMGRKADAATDIVRALEVYPDYPPALVERGKMKYSVGDDVGARKDWQKAAASGQGQAAVDARQYLEELAAAPAPAVPH